jgi:XFP N-terminal domain
MNESKTSAYGAVPQASKLEHDPTKASVSSTTLLPSSPGSDLLRKMDAWWRAANYLNIGQIYLMANPLDQRRHFIR